MLAPSITHDSQIEEPLKNPVKLAEVAAANHIETTDSMYAATIYQPWVHAYRACFFILIPDFMVHDWPHEVCAAMCNTRRMVKANAMRNYDGSAQTIGLQMTCTDATMNAHLALSSI